MIDLQEALSESTRCLLCFDPPCSAGCHAKTDPGSFIRKLRFRNVDGAARVVVENNPFGGVCAYICPTCKLCEEKCSYTGLDRPIRIAEIQQFLTRHYYDRQLHKNGTRPTGGPDVAVIGSGPAGLSAALYLAQEGACVTVFESNAKPGGVLRYGIPSFRLPRDILDEEIKRIEGMGVKIKCKSPVKGKGAARKLLRNFDAVFISTGLQRAYQLKVPGVELKNSALALDFLAEVSDAKKVDACKRRFNGKDVAIIGGGSVAIDAGMSARALGANRVYIISLESLNELPASQDEIDLAHVNHLIFRPSSQLTAIMGDHGAVTGIAGREIRWKKPGLFVPDNAEPVAGSEFSLKVDFCIQAIGSGVDDDSREIFDGIKLSPKGVILVDEHMKTSVDRIYAGGDIAAAPFGLTAVRAIGNAKTAAESILAKFKIPRVHRAKAQPRADLSIDFCGVHFGNPLLLSSSPVSNHREMVERAYQAGWGGAVYKTLGLEKKFKVYMPTPRLNAMHYEDKQVVGLQNVEQITDRDLRDNLADIKYLKKKYPEKVLVASIMGFDAEDWTYLASAATEAGADMLELNYSCPQMAREGAGHKVGQQYDLLETFTRAVRKGSDRPIMAKMTPNITDMIPPAMASKAGGADAISAINTIKAISGIDIDRLIPMPNVAGKSSISGFSGPAVKPIALRFVAELYLDKELKLDISGIGGIVTWIDALEFFLVGAKTVQVTTGVMKHGYRIVEDIAEGLRGYLERNGYKSIRDVVGLAAANLVDPSKLSHDRQVVAQIDPQKCIGCGQCHFTCHDSANQAIVFDAVKRIASVNEDRCVGCLMCRHVCPVWDCISYKTVPDYHYGEPPN